MARRTQPPKDLTGIRQWGETYQVRVSAGYDLVTGRQLMLSGSAETEDAPSPAASATAAGPPPSRPTPPAS